MRLHVAVRYDPTLTPFGDQVVSAMVFSGAFEGSMSAAVTRQRWQRLDRAMRRSACVVEVDDTVQISELTAIALAAAQAAGLLGDPVDDESSWQIRPAPDGRPWLADPVTGSPFELHETARTAGLLDEELVVLCVESDSQLRVMHSITSVADPAQLFAQLQFADRTTAEAPRIHGVLLYTDSDVELATFVRTHFDELNALSGDLFQISVFERPQNWRTAKRYWKDRLDPELYRMLAALRWLKWTPYDKLGAYDVARELGVPLSDLPCLVLLPGGRDRGRFVFPLASASTEAFRRLFSDLSETIHGTLPRRLSLTSRYQATHGPNFSWTLADRPGAAPAKPADEPIADRLAKAELRLRAEVRPAARESAAGESAASWEFNGSTVIIHNGGQAVTENFTFHGQTTFINRPVNTVITDFQNSHGTTSAGPDLAGLLQLVLASKELDDDQRELVAQLIHEVAGQLDGETPDQDAVRGRLERIRTTVGKAADIATPAISIVAKVLELLP